jgi:hypothetical protein
MRRQKRISCYLPSVCRLPSRISGLPDPNSLLHRIWQLLARTGPTGTSAIWPLSGRKADISQRIANAI